MNTVLTTKQSEDMNTVDLPIPRGATHIVFRSLPGDRGNDTHDWAVIVNPVVIVDEK